ncbi:hypothetical protein, partial [Paraburkholderia hospita]|uniref:hypothetical protein n=1 Tax=Paraburkholderia hospita TaxID=169430 RepID=UPI000B703B4C
MDRLLQVSRGALCADDAALETLGRHRRPTSGQDHSVEAREAVKQAAGATSNAYQPSSTILPRDLPLSSKAC